MTEQRITPSTARKTPGHCLSLALRTRELASSISLLLLALAAWYAPNCSPPTSSLSFAMERGGREGQTLKSTLNRIALRAFVPSFVYNRDSKYK